MKNKNALIIALCLIPLLLVMDSMGGQKPAHDEAANTPRPVESEDMATTMPGPDKPRLVPEMTVKTHSPVLVSDEMATMPGPDNPRPEPGITVTTPAPTQLPRGPESVKTTPFQLIHGISESKMQRPDLPMPPPDPP